MRNNKNNNDFFGFILKAVVSVAVIAIAAFTVIKLFEYIKTKKNVANSCDCFDYGDDWFDESEYENNPDAESDVQIEADEENKTE